MEHQASGIGCDEMGPADAAADLAAAALTAAAATRAAGPPACNTTKSQKWLKQEDH